MRVVLLRIRNRSVYIHFLKTFIHKNQQHTSVGVRSVFCSKCTCDFNVDRIGPLLTYDSYAHTHARWEGDRQIGRKSIFVLSSPLYCSKCFTLHPLAHLFMPTPSRLLWESIIHATFIERRSFVRIVTTPYSQVLIYTRMSCGNVG